MSVRDSNPLYLEVIEPLDAEGLPIEVDVFDSGDGATQLDTLQGAYEASFLRAENEEGPGSFKINRHDPKATEANLAADNVVRIKINGRYQTAFRIDEVEAVDASPDGGGSEELLVTGRGVLADLDRAQVYPAVWPSTTAVDVSYSAAHRGRILSEFIDRAQARGAIPHVRYDFTATEDSIFFPWTDAETDTYRVGTSLLDIAKKFAAKGGFDIRMDPFFRLSAFNSKGVDRTASVVFQLGRHLGLENIARRLHNTDKKSRLLVLGANSRVLEVVRPDLEADPTIGRREGFLDYSSTDDPQQLNDAGVAALDALARESEPLQITVTHGFGPGDFEPFIDYDVGDIVGIDVPPKYDRAPFRIVGITIGQIEGGDFKVILDLNAYYLDPLSALKQSLGNLGAAGSGGGAATVSSSGGPSGGPSAGTGKVAVELGDGPGYLSDKVLVGPGLSPSIVGTPPAAELQIDQDVAPAGGAAGEALVKATAADFDTEWAPSLIALAEQTIGAAEATIPHGLAYTPTIVLLLPTSAGQVWQSTPADATNIYLTADAAGRTCIPYVR